MTDRADFLFLTIGSRGDVQPFVDQAAELASRGKRVVVAAHAEYTALVNSVSSGISGGGTISYEEMPASLPIAMFETEEGRALKDAKGASAAAAAGKVFFQKLGKEWAEASLRLCKQHNPRVCVKFDLSTVIVEIVSARLSLPLGQSHF
jgi:UDP:flavonoid glycosyltransferase YjiC (YdhE family)